MNANSTPDSSIIAIPTATRRESSVRGAATGAVLHMVTLGRAVSMRLVARAEPSSRPRSHVRMHTMCACFCELATVVACARRCGNQQ